MFGDTPLVMVEDADTLLRVCETLKDQPVIGVDTESDSFHHYQEKVCLIQVSDRDTDYIVDPLKVPDLAPLKVLLEDPKILKVLHGADYDVVCLKRDFQITLTNVFDTMIASQFLAFPRIGLADLIDWFFGIRLDKKYQRHDWSQRPLREEHLQYARGDTHWLLALVEVLQHKLAAAGRTDAAREECLVLTQREWTGRSSHPADFLRLKGSNILDGQGRMVLRTLWEYRESEARRMDRPSFKAMPGDALIDIAKAAPTSMDALGQVIRPGASLYRKHGPALVAAVQAGLADERPLPEPPVREAPVRKGPRRAANDQLLGALKTWRNDIVRREHISPVVVASNQLLKEIATWAPADKEALEQIEGIRAWQVHAYGDQILAVVQDHPVRAGAARKPAGGRRRRRRKSGGGSSED